MNTAPYTITYRELNNDQIANIQCALHNHNSIELNISDCNKTYNRFIDILYMIFNIYAPEKKPKLLKSKTRSGNHG